MHGFILYSYFLENNRRSKLLASILYSFIHFMAIYDVLKGTNECPDCFGSNFCPYFEDQIELSTLSILSGIFSAEVSKSVYYASLNRSESIVLKKVSRNSHQLYQDFKQKQSSDLSSLMKQHMNLSDNESETRNVIICPKTANIRYLFAAMDNNWEKFVQSRWLWLNLEASIEPLLLQVFSTDKIWPVPKYHGACNNIIIEEYKGESLIYAYNLSWEKRAFLATQILQLAKTFTFHHSLYAFYLTDLSLDNLVYNSSGRVSLVDLDNLIIVDKSALRGDREEYKDVHVSEVIDKHAFSFSPSDICSHQISDHNFYAVCYFIFLHSDVMESGLLHDIPASVLETYTTLPLLLNECAVPQKYESRIPPAQELESLLHHIVKDFVWRESYF